MRIKDLIEYNREWVRIHKDNNYQREAAKRITVLVDTLEGVTRPNDVMIASSVDVGELADVIDVHDFSLDSPTWCVCGEWQSSQAYDDGGLSAHRARAVKEWLEKR